MTNVEWEREPVYEDNSHEYEKLISKYSQEIACDQFLNEEEKSEILACLKAILAAEMGISQRPNMPLGYMGEAWMGNYPVEPRSMQPASKPSMPMNQPLPEKSWFDTPPMGLSPAQWMLSNGPVMNNPQMASSEPSWLAKLKGKSLTLEISAALQNRTAKMQASSTPPSASSSPAFTEPLQSVAMNKIKWQCNELTGSLQPIPERVYRDTYVMDLKASTAFLWDIRTEIKSPSSSIQQKQSLKEVASTASNAIRSLLNDSDFQHDIKVLAEQYDHHKEKIYEELRDAKHVDDFLVVFQRNIQARRKYTNSELNYTIEKCKEVLDDVKNGKASVRELNTSLRELTLKTEIWEKELTEEIKEADEKSKKALNRLILGSLGMFLVGLSATPATLTTVIMANVGSALISRVVAEHDD